MINPLDALARALERGDLHAARAALDSLRQAMGLNTRVAAEVIHELRQPLLGIKAYAQMLKEDSHVHPEHALSEMLNQADRMEQIISDFTRIATAKPAPMERINLPAHVQKAQWVFCSRPESAGIQVDADALKELEIEGNGRLLEQLVLNLLNNARDAMSGKGRIKLKVAREDGIPVVYVADWGPGIPSAIRERIFEPYVTSKAHGSGLGLAVCQRIALDHGARIRLVPGYAFTDEVPPPTTVFQVAFMDAVNVPPSRHKILVVDDQPIIRTVFKDLLGKEMTVEEVSTGEEALERLEKESFDLLVTDKNLPGMSGLELARQAKALNRALRTILITGYPSVVTAQQAIELGIIEYLVKPFDDIRVVRETIRSAVTRPLPQQYQAQSRRVDVYEDNAVTAGQVTEALKLLGMESRVLTEPVVGGEELPCGLVVSWDFARAQGPKAVELGRTMGRGAPFVVLAEHLTMEAALESLRGGAAACLPKLLTDAKALSRELSRVLKLDLPVKSEAADPRGTRRPQLESPG